MICYVDSVCTFNSLTFYLDNCESERNKDMLNLYITSLDVSVSLAQYGIEASYEDKDLNYTLAPSFTPLVSQVNYT